MGVIRIAFAPLLWLLVSTFGFAEEASSDAELRKLLGSLHYQSGEISLEDGLAKLNVPDSFQFLNRAGATTVLSEIWGNPKDDDVLGMIVPKGFDPIAPNSWAVVLTYDDSGYVKDDEADQINYDSLLKEMQAGAAEANKERKEAGYPSIQIIGWAAPPRYDAATHKLYWAKELEFGGDPEHTLNYNIRVLGRRGVLVLNAVAGMQQLPEIEKEMPTVIKMVDFQEGHRYVDFDPKMDKVAGYGLAALVAGGIAAKTGFFKVLLGVIIAGKKFIIIGAIAIGAFVMRIIKGRQE